MSKQTSSVEHKQPTRIKNTEPKKNTMTKSELIEKISASQDQLPPKDVELAVRMILDRMTSALVGNQRIEIRGFGSFSLHYRAPRVGRNPKTGEAVQLTGKYVPYFKPGKELRTRVNDSL
ncbi:integration host factor subunit beta [Porticoccaceae bacterium]|nr:integration host factor subunit beta [Porticoccaceae bacterium]MDA9352324.1 integration host factor subunit beta [Porticoccaceae bacterium]MDB4262664.1 integration host factor subunit beta [Porticoccaceae bacterium]MDB4308692.1 integration host factor subunit beta [Porticoccaceae bacterium]MDB9953036.1 integration host factor subunit beta [Porticoccaceae bacterium]